MSVVSLAAGLPSPSFGANLEHHLQGSGKIVNCRVVEIPHERQEAGFARPGRRSGLPFALTQGIQTGVKRSSDSLSNTDRRDEAPSLDPGNRFVRNVRASSQIGLGEP
jgi:hypothetical protein